MYSIKQITLFASGNLTTYHLHQATKKRGKHTSWENYGVYNTTIHLYLKIIKKFLFLNAWMFQFIVQYFKRKKKKINDKWFDLGDCFSVASAQHRKKKWLPYFKYYISFGFCLSRRVIFNLFHLCKRSLVLPRYKDPPNTHLESVQNSSLLVTVIYRFSAV